MWISTASQCGIHRKNKNDIITPYGIADQITVSELVNRIPKHILTQDKSLCFSSVKSINKRTTQGYLPPLIFKHFLLRTIL